MKPSDILKAELDVQDEDILALVDEKFRVKTERKTKEVSFKAVPDFEVGTNKLPAQAKFLLEAIQETDDPVTYVTWGKLAVERGMGTKQDPSRIAAYYRPLLVQMGAVEQA
jgi:hypothetical protein